MLIRILALIISVFLFSGCLEDKGTSSEIVIPAGGLIQLELTQANKVSTNRYSLYLAQFLQEEIRAKNLLDLTTDEKPSLMRRILPKGLNPSGATVAKLIMEYRSTPWYAIVFSDVVVPVTLDSTLVYNLLANYGNRPLATFTQSEVNEITNAVTAFRKERMAMFGIDEDFNPDLLYRFVRNGLSNDVAFLTFLKKFDVNFNFNSDGDILSAPYPFGIQNRPPALDDRATTPLVDQRVNENSILLMKALALDPDGDQVFYAWMFEGQLIDSENGTVKWTPNYDQGRVAPYQMSVILSDGGKVTRVSWDVFVDNVNRIPVFSHNCDLNAVESKEWVCKIRYSDPDGGKVSAKILEIADSSQLSINGQLAPATINDANEVEIRWTPNNGDAFKKAGSISLELMDESFGVGLLTINVLVADTNRAPILVGGTTSGVNVIYNDPYEYDYCALEVPDGVPPYRFYLDFQDPDNLDTPAPTPPDEISYTTGGTLNANMSLVSKEQLADRLRVTYDWKPTHTAKTGTFIITLKDNHGGFSTPLTLNFTAQDRNTKPCLTTPNVVTGLSPNIFQSASTVSTSDKDGGGLWLEVFGFAANNSFDVLKLVGDCATGQPFVLKQNIAQDEPTFRKNSGSLCIRSSYNSIFWNGAGYVRFTRGAATTFPRPTASTTIKKGTILTSTAAGLYQRFATAMDVTILPQDYLIYIPVVALDTVVPAGKVTVLGTCATTGGTYTVTNSLPIDDQGSVTFTRTPATAIGTIPAGCTIKTTSFSGTPFVPDVLFEVPADVTIPANTSSVTIPVWRRFAVTPAATPLTITWAAPAPAEPAGFSFVSESVIGLTNYNVTSLALEPTFSTLSRKYNIRALDGDKPAVNTINAFMDPLPAGVTGLKVTNPTSFDLEGMVNFTRPTATPAFTLPKGTRITTSIRTQYETLYDVNFVAGTASVTGVWVRRINYFGIPNTAPLVPGETSRSLTLNLVRINNTSKIISETMVHAYEGQELTDGLIEVSDVASTIPNPLYTENEYWYPKDRRDSYSFVLAAQGTPPAGGLKLCREPGAYASACNSCSYGAPAYLPLAAYRSYFKSSKCYIRYQPNALDLSGTFSYKLTTYENLNSACQTGAVSRYCDSSTYFVNNTYYSALVYTTNLTLVVHEVNHPPVLTNSSFTALTGGAGASTATPVVLGDYAEGTSSFYNFYVTDSNKGEELKNDNFEIQPQVYDLKTSTWRDRPAGLTVSIDRVDPLTATSGTKTTARLTWNPTDAESKQFSGAAGLIVKIKVFDAKSSPDVSTSTYGYYKVRLINKNQIPTITTMDTDNKVKVFADTYVKKEFFLYDKDAFVPMGGTFATTLTACRDGNGVALQHPTLDTGAADPFICHATTATFPVELTTYDPAYDRNKNLTQCYSSGVLNADLAVPKFSPAGAPEVINGVLRQKYQMEWCPQRGQIGVFSAEIDVNDNGDVDRDGVALPPAISGTPLLLTVVAPVYLVSPRVSIMNVPTHHMIQTAASMNEQPFRYDVIVKNSQEHSLEYSLLSSPRECGVANGVCIDSSTGVITWVPNYSLDITPAGSPGSLIRVQVKDTVTGDVDSAHFYLKVQSALSPFEKTPVIDSSVPSGNNILVAEKSSVVLSVNASDPNPDDVLFYRWYVNEKISSDESSSFTFKPSDMDGSLDPDGNGPKKAGEFTIRVEVTDGNYVVSRSWDVKVLNTFLLGDSVFDLTTSRAESSPSITPTNVNWMGEIAYGQLVGNDNLDHLIIAGNYMSGSFQKHFLWDLLMVNGNIGKPNGNLVNPPWNFTEDLPWLTGTSTRRIAINPVGTGYDMLMTSASARSGPFGLTTEALHIMNGDLTSLALASNNKCAGDCPLQLYTSPYYSDSRITTSMDSTYVFYASDAGNVLYYDYLAPSNPKTVYNFGTMKISGMTLNRSINRLYVTAQQTSPTVLHKIFVFDVTAALSGGIPSLVTSLNVFDGVVGHEDSKPSDILYDSTNNRVYALLSGTGGVVTFPDSGSTTPTVGSMEFIGVNQLNGSPFDVPGAGKRLVIRPQDRLLIGTMEGANQVFTVDLTTNTVYVSAVQNPITSIASYPSGQILLVSRSKGKVYKAK